MSLVLGLSLKTIVVAHQRMSERIRDGVPARPAKGRCFVQVWS